MKIIGFVLMFLSFSVTKLYAYDDIVEVNGLRYGISYYYDNSLEENVYFAELAKYGDVKYAGDAVIQSHVMWGENMCKVVSIATSAFKNCEGLTSVFIPSSIGTISEFAFEGCNGMQALYIEDLAKWCNISILSVKANPLVYAHNLYLNGNLVEHLRVPDTVESINGGVFRSCYSLKSVTIPNSVKLISGGAFYECKELETVDMGPSVERIGESAFCDCYSLRQVSMSAAVTDVGDNAFRGCSALERVDITDLAAWMNINFDYTYTSTRETNPLENAKSLYLNGEELTKLVVPESITEIKDRVFSCFEGLKHIVFHKNVTKIASRAFYHCTGLEFLEAYMDEPVSLLTETPISTHVSNIIAFVPQGAGAYNSIDNGIWGYCKYGSMVEPYDDLEPVMLSVNDYTRTYGDENPEFTYTVDHGTIVSGQPEITCEATPETGITGSYDRSKPDIKLTRGTISNSKVYCRSAKLIITKAPLTVSVGNYKRLEGKANPKFEILYSGFKNNDKTTVFTNYPKATTTATKTSPPGNYEIKVYNATAANYDITFQNGMLTVLALGDANGDMEVNVDDVVSIVNHIAGKTNTQFEDKAADLNGNGKVDIGDVVTIANRLVGESSSVK